MNRRTEEVKLYQERYSYIFGWVVTGLITAYYMLFILLISSATNVVAWKQMLAQLTVAGICAATLWVFNWMMISPYRLLQRSKAAPLKTENIQHVGCIQPTSMHVDVKDGVTLVSYYLYKI